MHYVAMFFAGLLICNSIPHLASGLRGEAFPTPFATPRGIGRSSPLINVVWGCANLLAGGFLVVRQGIPVTIDAALLAGCLGFIVMGVFSAIHFGKARKTWE
jgi:hypothetical protein